MAERSEVAIIGAGPAGISAAIYLHRADVRLILLEKGETGGLLRNANLVENYPGFPEGITGIDLAGLFREQLEGLGIEVTEACVTKVQRDGAGFSIRAGRRVFRADAVIVGTGTRPRMLGIRGERRLAHRKIYYTIAEMPIEGTSPQDVIVIGGGDAAFDYALNLHGRGHKVKIVSRSTPRCLGLLERRVEEAGITVITGSEAQSIEARGEGVALACIGKDGPSTLTGDLVLAACGREPELGLLDRTLSAGLRVRNGGPGTNVPGMYLVGDVIRGNHRQTGIAVGDGVLAAMMVERSIAKRRTRG